MNQTPTIYLIPGLMNQTHTIYLIPGLMNQTPTIYSIPGLMNQAHTIIFTRNGRLHLGCRLGRRAMVSFPMSAYRGHSCI
jgi:hypothetical protein